MSRLVTSFPIAYEGRMDLYTSQNGMSKLHLSAPRGEVCSYDRLHLPLYAQLLDAEAAGMDWIEGAAKILRLDSTTSATQARACWDSHLARAHWIVGEGLESAISVFGQ